jgi:SAM-dependent methyltransferase
MTCKICKHNKLSKLYFLQGYQIWQCDACKFGQVEITPDELTAFYDKSYFDGEKARFGQTVEDDVRPSHAYWLETYLKKAGNKRPLHILDIGPGLGVGFGKYLRKHYPQNHYEAVEISDFAVASIRNRGFTAHLGRASDQHVLDACRGCFDLVVGTEVIEHDPEPHEFIAAVHTMLKPGGICAFTTGNLRGLVARRQKASWYYLDPPAHVSYYTPEAAAILFREQHFTDLYAWKIGFNYITLKLNTHVPGILTLAHLLSLPTGMSISARKPMIEV